MKKCMLFFALGLVGASVLAQEARVISSQPVIQQVAVPRQVCSQQPYAVQQQPYSGGGAIVGAIVGGLLGNQIGHGMGRAAATAGGVVAGAAIGNQVGSQNQGYAVGPNCTTQTTYENRTVGYDVTYEYNGQQHTARMAHDPGPTVQLQVAPVGANVAPAYGRPQPQALYAPGAAYAPGYVPQIIEPAVTVMPAPVVVHSVAPVYYRPYSAYYAPFYPSISLNFGYSRGHRWHGHRHYRHWR
jgi:uncharacterized protein YcfJ